MRTAFIRTLMSLARTDPRIWLLTADLGFSVFEEFDQEFPDRFLNVGIAESTMVGVAAGLAHAGYYVFIYSIIPFATMRCFEQLRVDVCYPGLNVKVIGVGGGFSYGMMGATHHAIEDVAVMRALPGMQVMSPGDPIEVEACVQAAMLNRGPLYIRLGKNGEPVLHASSVGPDDLGMYLLRQGDDTVILATGSLVHTGVQVVEILSSMGINASLWSVPLLKPTPDAGLKRALANAYLVCTLEEHSVIGGLGSMVAEWLADQSWRPRLRRFGIPDCFASEVGSQEFLRRSVRLAPDQIASAIQQEVSALAFTERRTGLG